MKNFVEYHDAQKQATDLAQIIAKQMVMIANNKQQVNIALPGGTTPKLFFEALLKQEIDWQKLYISPTDERFVDATDSRSNSLMIANIFDKIDAHLISWHQNNKNIADVAVTLSQRLAKMLPLDICVLGMGDDMHIASLFPNGDNLTHALSTDCNDIIVPMNAPATTEPRLTLTAPIIMQAQSVHLLIKGHSKKEALARAENSNSAITAPVKIILDHPNLTIHYTNE